MYNCRYWQPGGSRLLQRFLAVVTVVALLLSGGLLSPLPARAQDEADPVVGIPTASPAAGTYDVPQEVALTSATLGADIYYTTDGSDPTTSSTKYSVPIHVGGDSVTGNTTVKAIAVKSGLTDSDVAEFEYTIFFAGGSGTEEDPYEVATPAHLNNVRERLNAYFKQTADIDLNVEPYKTDRGWEPIGTEASPFEGVYDGDGKAISNLLISGNEQNVGLFGYIQDKTEGGPAPTVRNVTLEGVNVAGYDYVGSLAGIVFSGAVESCSAAGEVAGTHSYVGGLIGLGHPGATIADSHTAVNVSGQNSPIKGGLLGASYGGTIESCSASGNVTGQSAVGGLVGIADPNTTITESYSTGDVEGQDADVGGLVGRAFKTSITKSHSTGKVQGGLQVGGLVGTLDDFGSISESYSTGDVQGESDCTGGLVGRVWGTSTVSKSHSEGKVTGKQYVGGLVGEGNMCSINDSYATGAVSGATEVGGLVGHAIETSITESHSTSKVQGEGLVGGLVGTLNLRFDRGSITESYSTGDVEGLNADDVGGLVGFSSGKIVDSYASGAVTGKDCVGGLVGANRHEIKGAHSMGAVTGEDYVGGLVGSNFGDSGPAIEDCCATGAVMGNNSVGGLVGGNMGALASIKRSFATGSVTGSGHVGGLVGENQHEVLDSHYTGGTVSGELWVGGLVGSNTEAVWGVETLPAVIERSYSTANVVNTTAPEAEGGVCFGGLVGSNDGTIRIAYAAGSVTGMNCVGGLVGGDSGSISYAYATGNVTGTSFVGGLVGACSESSVNETYAVGTVIGEEAVGGLVGLAEQDSTVEKSYWNMQTTGQADSAGGDQGSPAESLMEVQNDLYHEELYGAGR